MKITVLAVGAIKESYLKEAIAEYSKRLSKYAKLTLIQVEDEPLNDRLTEKEKTQIKEKEAARLLKVMPPNSFKIALNLKGQMLSSEELALKMATVCSYQNSHLVFVIGGSLGLGDSLLRQMDYHLCFSKMTFPHPLMKVILLEQIYRCFKINHHETYHK